MANISTNNNYSARSQFQFKIENNDEQIQFDSDFDSGNCAKVIQTRDNQYEIYTQNDSGNFHETNSSKSWFYFSVKGFKKGDFIRFNVHRVHMLQQVYNADQISRYKPVFKVEGQKFQRLEQNVQIMQYIEDDLILGFNYIFKQDNQKVYFAFTYPYSHEKNLKLIKELETFQLENQQSTTFNPPNQLDYFDNDIYIHTDEITQSIQGRSIHLLTITSYDGILNEHENNIDDNLFKYNQDTFNRARKFNSKKPIIFLTARVHPGETPASFAIEGAIKFLLNKNDLRSFFLRKYFVFKIIPMINPDGVYNGHYRRNTLNQNLNRFYLNPNLKDQPEIYAIKQFLDYYQNDIKFYMDFHSHAGNKGHFVYGNAYDDIFEQAEATYISKLIGFNCPNFEFEHSCFSKKQMKTKDKFEELTKEGAGRVVAYTQNKIVHSFTFELGFHRANKWEPLNKPQNEAFKFKNMEYTEEKGEKNNYQDQDQWYFQDSDFQVCGKAVLCSLLDYYDKNIYSRMLGSTYKNKQQIKREIILQTLRSDRFKRDPIQTKKMKQKMTENLYFQNQIYDYFMQKQVFQILDAKIIQCFPQNFQAQLQQFTPIQNLSKSKQNMQNSQKQNPQLTSKTYNYYYMTSNKNGRSFRVTNNNAKSINLDIQNLNDSHPYKNKNVQMIQQNAEQQFQKINEENEFTQSESLETESKKTNNDLLNSDKKSILNIQQNTQKQQQNFQYKQLNNNNIQNQQAQISKEQQIGTGQELHLSKSSQQRRQSTKFTESSLNEIKTSENQNSQFGEDYIQFLNNQNIQIQKENLFQNSQISQNNNSQQQQRKIDSNSCIFQNKKQIYLQTFKKGNSIYRINNNKNDNFRQEINQMFLNEISNQLNMQENLGKMISNDLKQVLKVKQLNKNQQNFHSQYIYKRNNNNSNYAKQQKIQSDQGIDRNQYNSCNNPSSTNINNIIDNNYSFNQNIYQNLGNDQRYDQFKKNMLIQMRSSSLQQNNYQQQNLNNSNKNELYSQDSISKNFKNAQNQKLDIFTKTQKFAKNKFQRIKNRQSISIINKNSSLINEKDTGNLQKYNTIQRMESANSNSTIEIQHLDESFEIDNDNNNVNENNMNNSNKNKQQNFVNQVNHAPQVQQNCQVQNTKQQLYQKLLNNDKQDSSINNYFNIQKSSSENQNIEKKIKKSDETHLNPLYVNNKSQIKEQNRSLKQPLKQNKQMQKSSLQDQSLYKRPQLLQHQQQQQQNKNQQKTVRAEIPSIKTINNSQNYKNFIQNRDNQKNPVLKQIYVRNSKNLLLSQNQIKQSQLQQDSQYLVNTNKLTQLYRKISIGY